MKVRDFSSRWGRWRALALASVLSAVVTVGVAQASAAAAPPNNLSVATLPGSTSSVLVRAIDSSRTDINLIAFRLTDKSVEGALARAQHRHVRVRVILGHVRSNVGALHYLQAKHVGAQWAFRRYTQTHADALAVGDSSVLVASGGFGVNGPRNVRAFAVSDTSRADVTAFNRTFVAMWKHHILRRVPTGSGDLLWSPGAGSRLGRLISNANGGVLLEAEDITSPGLEHDLCVAAKAHVQVQIVAAHNAPVRPLQNLAGCGAQVRREARGRVVSANAIVATHNETVTLGTGGTTTASVEEAYEGTATLTPLSLDHNRELGVISSSPSLVSTVTSSLTADFNSGAVVHSRFYPCSSNKPCAIAGDGGLCTDLNNWLAGQISGYVAEPCSVTPSQQQSAVAQTGQDWTLTGDRQSGSEALQAWTSNPTFKANLIQAAESYDNEWFVGWAYVPDLGAYSASLGGQCTCESSP